MKWRYSLRWTLPRTPCPGPQELVSEVVEAGQPAPESVMARRRNLERRVNRIAPLFADEFIRRELDARPAYFQGKTMNMPPKGRELC